jgi:hypothetical protein
MTIPTIIPIARILSVPARQDVAGRGVGVEMQLDTARLELAHHVCNTLLDRRMIRAVAGDEFLDHSPQRRGRQLRVPQDHPLT